MFGRRPFPGAWKGCVRVAGRFPVADFPFPASADSRLKLSQAQGNLSVLETQQVQLECVVLNRTSAASQLAVEWFVWKPNHPERETVARLSREATFHYGEQAAKNNLKGRLHLESPSSGTYRLFIQNVAVQDSGTYSCHVEEWLPSPRGVWYKRAEDTAGQTAVTVTRPGEGCRPSPGLHTPHSLPSECDILCAA